jgi:hypothetical protein
MAAFYAGGSRGRRSAVRKRRGSQRQQELVRAASYF